MTEHSLAPASRGREVVWSMVDLTGMEHARLEFIGDKPEISGSVIAVDAGEPVLIHYAVICDRAWHTREVTVIVSRSSNFEHMLRLISNGDGDWRQITEVDGVQTEQPLGAIQGCIDIDLAFSPVTNTLPIRRIGMVVGATVQTTAAWIQFPTLELTTLPQSYTRFDLLSYRYESHLHDFRARIDIDDLGLVTRYEHLWNRVAESSFGALSEHDFVRQET